MQSGRTHAKHTIQVRMHKNKSAHINKLQWVCPWQCGLQTIVSPMSSHNVFFSVDTSQRVTVHDNTKTWAYAFTCTLHHEKQTSIIQFQLEENSQYRSTHLFLCLSIYSTYTHYIHHIYTCAKRVHMHAYQQISKPWPTAYFYSHIHTWHNLVFAHSNDQTMYIHPHSHTYSEDP